MKVKVSKIIKILKESELFISANIDGEDIEINNITIDSRDVTAKDVFIAIEGFEQDGHRYIKQAIEAGASLIIQSKEVTKNSNNILVENSRKAGALIASEIYGNPSSKIKLIGLTGTNGKTTTSTIIFDFLNKMGIKCGIIGTLGYSFGDELIPLARTTPDISDLNQILAQMVENKCQVVVMEVSSHSLVLDRVYGQKFDAIGFTNLTQDHLDFHSTFENYFLAKKILFDTAEATGAFAVVNTDDEYGRRYYESFSKRKLSYGLNPQLDIFASDINNKPDSTNFTLNYGNKKETIETNYVGDFNIYNLMLALTLCRELFPEIEFNNEVLKNLKRTSGRLEPVESNAKGKVFVDYAHTPDAIKQVLSTLRKTEHKRIISVLGCGGDRDKAKRRVMSKLASQLSEISIFTDDNPRWENNNLIIADMITDLEADNYFVIRDRKMAIECALRLSKEDDIVVILGKGHENYQEIRGEKLHFSDAEVVKNYSDNIPKADLAIPYDPINLLDLKFKFEDNTDILQYTTFPDMIINNISTDSRTIKSNSLFVAIRGDIFDGNDFIDQVLSSSQTTFTVGEIDYPSHFHIKVKNALHFYGFMAKRYLKLFNVNKIALTGSTGKTTTKEIITNILEENNSVLKTHGNENNYIGLPRTIFRIKTDNEYAVFEIGTNNFGEIGYLSDIIEPDYALITSVDSAHLEKLGSLEGVYKEKTALFKRKLKGFLFPGDNPMFAEYKNQEFRNIGYSVGIKKDNSFVYNIIKIDSNQMILKINNSQYQVNNIVPYFGLNFAYAISLAKLLEISINDIIYGLQKTLNTSNRMSIIKNDKQIIIADCYNANPKSTKAAIEFWINYLPEKEHIAILGDMLELGKQEDYLHNEIKKILKKLTNIKIYTVGKLSKLYDGNAHFENINDFLKSRIFKELPDGVVLIKGSHGIHLEKILENV